MPDEPLPEDDIDLEPPEPLPDGIYPADPPRPTINELWEQSLREQEVDATRFTLSDLGIAVTVASVLMALTSLLPIASAAATLGLITLIGGIVLALRSVLPRSAILSWWVLLGLYLFFSLIAIITT